VFESLRSSKQSYMPKIEVDCRYKRELTNNERLEAETERIIKGEDYNPAAKYGYIKFSFDLLDVKNFNVADEKHTCVHFYDGDSAVIMLNYLKFKQMYCFLTGQGIIAEEDFVLG
jgi:hypothetical protein